MNTGWSIAPMLVALLLNDGHGLVESPWEREQSALCLMQQQQYDKAIEIYTDLIRLGPPWQAPALHNRGVASKNSGFYLNAIEDFTEALRLDPHNADSLASRSTCLCKVKRFDLALADAHAAVRLAPKDFVSFHKRAEVWFAMGKYACALADYDRAVELGVNIPACYQYRAWFLATCPDKNFRNGRRALDDAAAAYELCFPPTSDFLDPDGCQGIAAMETLAAASAECGDFQSAVAWQQCAVNRIPADQPDHDRAEDRRTRYRQGYTYASQPIIPPRQLPSALIPPPAQSPAIAVGTRIILSASNTELHPVDPNGTRGAALVYRVENQTGSLLQVAAGDERGSVDVSQVVTVADAPKYFAETIKADPSDAWAYAGRGAAWREMGEYKLALEDFDDAIRRDPDDPRAYSARAWILSSCPSDNLRDGGLAVISAKRACTLTSEKRADALEALAAAYAEFGDFHNAEAVQRKALALLPVRDPSAISGGYRLQLYVNRMSYHVASPAIDPPPPSPKPTPSSSPFDVPTRPAPPAPEPSLPPAPSPPPEPPRDPAPQSTPQPSAVPAPAPE